MVVASNEQSMAHVDCFIKDLETTESRVTALCGRFRSGSIRSLTQDKYGAAQCRVL